jgi:hypothetical protein
MERADTDKLLELLERSAVAQERLIELATEERDAGDSIFGPPFCPHCGIMSPDIRNEGGEGSFSEFVLKALCGNCQGVIFAVPQGWLCYPNAPLAREEMERRNGTS